MIRYCYLLIMMIAACSRPTETFQAEQVEADVREVLENYHRDIQREGLMAEFKYLDSSEDFFWIPPGYDSPLSYDSVYTILEASAQVILLAEFKWDTLNVIPLSPEIATYNGIVSGKITHADGVVSLSAILESGTLIRRKDGWKLLSGQSVLINK